MSVRAAFEAQARACGRLGSPFLGRLLALAAERLQPGSAVADRVLGWTGNPAPSADSVPLRFAGALHALKLQGLALGDVFPPQEVPDDVLWQAVDATFTAHEGDILHWLDSPPQTNEVRRSAVILAAMAVIHKQFDLPFDLSELGASGGLNLRADQFRLETAAGTLGPANARVVLQPDWSGPFPEGAIPQVRQRAGVDLNPLDPGSAAGRLRLLAYLWPDQADRAARTEAAIAVARDVPATVESADAAAWLETALRPRPGHVHLIYHTVAWQYFPKECQTRAAALIEAAGAKASADAPLAWFGMESDGGKGAALTLRMWPGGETRALGRADFHGRWIDWAG